MKKKHWKVSGSQVELMWSIFDYPVGGSTGPLNPVYYPFYLRYGVISSHGLLEGHQHLCSPILPSESCQVSSMHSGRGLSSLLHFRILPSHCQTAAQPLVGLLSSYSDWSGEVLPSYAPPQSREQAAIVSKALWKFRDMWKRGQHRAYDPCPVDSDLPWHFLWSGLLLFSKLASKGSSFLFPKSVCLMTKLYLWLWSDSPPGPMVGCF